MASGVLKKFIGRNLRVRIGESGGRDAEGWSRENPNSGTSERSRQGRAARPDEPSTQLHPYRKGKDT
jgi:hypothetical protein